MTVFVAATDPPGIYTVLTPRTHLLSTPLPPGCIFRINTGGPLPAGADAVIMVEDTRLRSTHRTPLGEEVEEAEVETLVQVPRGENVRDPGSDVRQGDLVLERGTVVNSAGGEVGTLAFVGRTKVSLMCIGMASLLDDTYCWAGSRFQETRGSVVEYGERAARRPDAKSDTGRWLGRNMGYQSALTSGGAGRLRLRGP